MRKKWLGWVAVLLLALVFCGMAFGEEETNLVGNGGFEILDGSGNATDWYSNMYRRQEGYSRAVITQEKAHTGLYSALIENANLNDARYVYRIAVKPNTMYRFSGYIWVENMSDQGNGANLALEDVFAHSNGVFEPLKEWQYVEWYGFTGPKQREAEIGVRIGGYGAETVGKAYFDDISIVEVPKDALPSGVTADVWFKEEVTPAPDTSSMLHTAPQKSTLLFGALALLFVIIAFVCVPLLREKESPLLAEGETEKKGGGKVLLAVFGVLLLASLVLRIVLARSVAGYQVDINCFSAWSLRMVSVGPMEFYSPDVFCDYPPGAMLLLWPVGLVLSAVGTANTPGMLLTLKFIPILCDMVIAILLFCFARKRIPAKAAAFLALLYAFNPASIVNGAAWGQMDSLLALIMLLTAFAAMERKWMAAIPLLVVGALMKPQALLLAPVGVVWLASSLIWGPERKKQLVSMLRGLLIAVACAVAIVLPFALNQLKPVEWLVSLYSDTLSSYGYATVNTANLYYLLGDNWQPLTEPVHLALPLVMGLLMMGFGLWGTKLYAGAEKTRNCFAQLRAGARKERTFSQESRRYLLAALSLLAGTAFVLLAILGCTYQTYGMAIMAFIYAWVCLGAFTEKDARKLPFWLSLALIGIYVLGIKVHERYLFVALPLMLVAYATTKDKRLIALCVGFSATTFMNTAIVLDNCILYGSQQGHLNADTLPLNSALCALNLLLCLYAGYVSVAGVRESVPAAEGKAVVLDEEGYSIPPKRGDSYRRALLSPKDARLRLVKWDWLIMGIAMVIYSAMTFVGLGSTVAPQNPWVSSSAEEQIVFEVDTDQAYTLLYYGGISYDPFSVATSEDGENWSKNFPCKMEQGICFRWQYAIKTNEETGEFLDHNLENRQWLTGRYLRLNADAVGLNLMELMTRDEQGNALPMKVISHTGAKASVLAEPKPPENLLDEQSTLVGEPGYFNGTYFDEIYHARTGYEHLHGLDTCEWTHPPLGKLFMSLCIAVFGMTPFGWRFAGAFAGVMMLPVLYLLAKQIFRRRDLAAFSMLLLMFDLMHFTQTRIATIDSFPVLFIMVSYLLMARYMMMDVFAMGENEKPRLFTKGYLRSLGVLALCGFFMGLSIASKWIGLYSAVGLAVLFFASLFRQYRIGNMAFDYSLEEENQEQTPRQKLRLKGAQEYALTRVFITCLCCLVFFILVPLVIYYLSYIPQLLPGGAVTIQRIIDVQESMLKYHGQPGLGMEHPFQSPWWQWPFILKPMWFFKGSFAPEGFGSTIFCMGNPLIFYVGAFCMVGVLLAFVAKYFSLKDGLRLKGGDGNMALTVMTIGFLAQYLPWILVPRSMYIYHYFASVPFIILATAWVVSFLPKGKPRLRQWVMWGYVALAAVLFIMFYPYASGAITPTGWLEAMKWFPKLYY